MKYNNYGKQHRRNHGSHSSNAGGQSYVWRVKWYNWNVRNGADQYKSFRSKTQALMFRDKLESNPKNYVYSGIEKVSC